MTTLNAPEGFRELLALVDQPGAEAILLYNENHSAVLLSETAFEDLIAPNRDFFKKFSEQLSASFTARGLTEEKLSEVLTSQ